MSIQHHSLGWASVTGNYALRQDATGVTDLNCASSKSIGFLNSLAAFKILFVLCCSILELALIGLDVEIL